MRRLRLYSLKTRNEKSELNFDLTGLIVTENYYTLQIKLPSGEVFLNIKEYMNTMKIYDDGEVFFIVCNKMVDLDYAKDILMKYALERVDKTIESLSMRVEKLNNFKERLKREMIAA